MRYLPLFIVTILCASVSADVVYLKDGTRLQGDVKKGKNGYVITLSGGDSKVVPFEEVKSIELATAPAPTVDSAAEKLASLRHSVDYVDSIDKIIERYQRFIEGNAGTPAADEAKVELARWQLRKEQGLVRYGLKWVTPQEKIALQEQSIGVIDNARRLLRQGRLAEAETLIRQVLTQDPQNVSALYLRGLIEHRQDKVLAARKTFDQVNSILPNHAPTLNNLATIMYRQNQVPTALATYDQAMTSSPKNRDILNNVAEALNALPDEQRGSQMAQRVARHYTEQDTDLQRELAKEGVHRWGANWVTTEQLDQLKAAERQVRDKLDALSADFDATKVRISNIDQDIEETERAMRRMEVTSYVRDFNGNWYQATLPSSYYQLQDDIRKLQRDRDTQFAKLDRLRAQAKTINQELPIPKYTGVQRLIDVEGTPIDIAEATTQPATQPSRG